MSSGTTPSVATASCDVGNYSATLTIPEMSIASPFSPRMLAPNQNRARDVLTMLSTLRQRRRRALRWRGIRVIRSNDTPFTYVFQARRARRRREWLSTCGPSSLRETARPRIYRWSRPTGLMMWKMITVGRDFTRVRSDDGWFIAFLPRKSISLLMFARLQLHVRCLCGRFITVEHVYRITSTVLTHIRVDEMYTCEQETVALFLCEMRPFDKMTDNYYG